jgi:hypothetical protein
MALILLAVLAFVAQKSHGDTLLPLSPRRQSNGDFELPMHFIPLIVSKCEPLVHKTELAHQTAQAVPALGAHLHSER